jgi:hypothetical protein
MSVTTENPRSSVTPWIEEVTASGEELVTRVKAIVSEGNVRRVSVKHHGQPLMEFPLTIGVVGALLAPQVAALGAIAAMVTNCTISVERGQPSTEQPNGGADKELPATAKEA